MNAATLPTSTPGVLGGLAAFLGEMLRLLVAHLPVVAAVVLGVVLVVAGLREWLGRRRHRRAIVGAQRVQILPGPRVDPAGAQVFWAHLLGLLPPRWSLRRARRRAGGFVVFEFTFTAAGLAVSVWVPGTVPAALVAAAARSAWPGARTVIEPAAVETHPAAPQARRGAPGAGPAAWGEATPQTGARSAASTSRVVPVAAAGGVLRLARPAGLPLRTDHPVDPLRALIGAVGPLRPGQRVVVQVLARPMSSTRFAATARSRARGGAAGLPALLASAAGVVAVGLANLVQEVVEVAVHGPAHRPHHPTSAARSRAVGNTASGVPGKGVARRVDSARDRAIAGKVHGAAGGYRTTIRYLTTTAPHDASPDAARSAQHASAGRAHAVAASFAEFSGHNHYRRRPLRQPQHAIAQRCLRRGDALSVAEVAAVAHLPTDEHVPGLRRAGAAAIAPPPQIPTVGAGVRPLGESDAIPGRPVGVSVPDARHHVWIVGATGAGKSTLCVHGILADAAAGRAAIVLDPKGDLVTDIYARLPKHARARTVLIDPDRAPADGRWPCLNPLDPPRCSTGQPGDAVGLGVGGDGAVENVVSVFSRVFSSAWGHRTEDLLRVGCLTLRAAHGSASPSAIGPALSGPANLADLPALLTDPAARRAIVARLKPKSRLRQFWDWYEQLPESAQAQFAAPLLNKLRAVLLRPFAEHLLCGSSTVDLSRLLDSGGLLLVRLPKGVLGEDTVRLIGSLLVSQVWQAALGRATQPEHQRRDASLLLDECHNFLNLPYRIEDMLAEARGFRLSLTLAHQHLGQLTPALREGIATNARNKIMFAVSPDDATHLARHTQPELDPHDLSHLDGFHAAARLMTGTGEARAFTLTTRPLPPLPGRAPVPPTPHRPGARPSPGNAWHGPSRGRGPRPDNSGPGPQPRPGSARPSGPHARPVPAPSPHHPSDPRLQGL